MRIGKYEFTDKAQADSKIEALGEEHNHTIVKLGHIVLQPSDFNEEAVLSDKYHVDVMWTGLKEHPYGWKSYAIGLSDNGVHSFLGIDYQEYKL